MKQITQYNIVRKNEGRVVFLDRNDLKVGQLVKLKGETEFWQVMGVWATVEANDVKSVRDFDSDHRTKIERRVKV